MQLRRPLTHESYLLSIKPLLFLSGERATHLPGVILSGGCGLYLQPA